jgi:hypothetical protein
MGQVRFLGFTFLQLKYPLTCYQAKKKAWMDMLSTDCCKAIYFLAITHHETGSSAGQAEILATILTEMEVVYEIK